MRFLLSGRWFVCFVLALAVSAIRAGEDIDVAVEPLRIIDQHIEAEFGKVACGPTAIMNSLAFAKGDEAKIFAGLLGGDTATRLRFLIDKWFVGRASVAFTGTRRFGHHGCYVSDLTAGYNEILSDHSLPAVSGMYLDRNAEEAGKGTEREFVRRIHRTLADSLSQGIPPIISLRSFIARKPYGESDESRWKVARQHFVVVTSVPEKLAESDLGFRFEYIDPDGGKMRSAFVFAEQHLPFRAFKGENGVGEWLRGTPFLLVVAPGLQALEPKGIDWPDRVIITLNYGIFR